MSFFRIIEKLGINPDLCRVSQWPTVDEDSIPAIHKDRFLKLKAAGRAYGEGTLGAKEVAKLYGVSDSVLRERTQRAITTHPDGRLYGERAFVPYARDAERTVAYSTYLPPDGQSGSIEAHFRQFPELGEELKALYKRGDRHQDIGEHWHRRQRAKGVQDHHYPFNQAEQGLRSLQTYVERIQNSDFRGVSGGRSGKDAGRRADHTGPDIGKIYVRPYERIELDTHSKDAVFTALIRDVDGRVKRLPLARFVVILLIDCYTRCVLGYNVSVNTKENTQDVLEAIARSLHPSKEGKPTGLPVDLGPQYHYRVFEEIGLDNSKVQLSANFHEIIHRNIQPTINLGSAGTPEGRAIVESFFKKLTNNSLQRLPSTTGGKPDSPKRKNPEAKAVRYEIDLDDAQEILRLVVLEYQMANHDSLRQSPLERYRDYYRTENTPVRKLLPALRQLKFLFQRRYEKTVAGGVRTGGRCHINFLNAQYTNATLAGMGTLARRKIVILVDTRDLRTVQAFRQNGESLGILSARGQWGRIRHSLKTRTDLNAVNSRRKREKKPSYGLAEYLESIRARIKDSKRARNKVVRLEKEQSGAEAPIDGTANDQGSTSLPAGVAERAPPRRALPIDRGSLDKLKPKAI